MRYLILTSHYKKGINFSWKSLKSAQNALDNLRSQISNLKSQTNRTVLSQDKETKIESFRNDFVMALSDDINVSQALAVLWEVLKSNIPSEDKYDLAISFDEVLGLNLGQIRNSKSEIPNNIKILMTERERLRKEKKFEEADEIRKQIEDAGFGVNDSPIE